MEPALSNSPAFQVQQEVQAMAQKTIDARPVYLDTETTGLEKTDEIVEISIIDFDSTILFQSLVKPSSSIPPAATRVHGISKSDVDNAPTWLLLWPQIRSVLFGRLIAAYNAQFDSRMMQQSHARYQHPWRESFQFFDVMALYSSYRGVWDPYRSAMRFFSLKEAGNQLSISLPNAHRAAADALLTRAVLHTLAGIPY